MSTVITGNPGVGKHSITEKIAEKLGLTVLDINEIAKESKLFEEDVDTNDVDTKKLQKIIEERITEKNLIVGHLAPYVLEKNQVKSMIVLRRNPYDLIRVYKNRKYSDFKIKENAGSEVLGVIAHDAISKFGEKVFQINTSGKTIEDVAEKAINVILNNEVNENVDWLDLVTKNNDLRKFFAD